MAKEETDSNQSEADPQEADVTSGEGGDQESADQTSNDDASQLTLAELEAVTGKTFESKEKALKSLRDTTSYVGDLGSKVAKYQERYGSLDQESEKSKDDDESTSDSDNDVMTKEDYRREKWFDSNPQFAAHRDVIEALSEKHNVKPEEVVEMEGVKSLFSSRTELEELKSQKSVATSNNRVGQKSEEMDEANKTISEASQARLQGDHAMAERKSLEAKGQAVDAVMKTITGE